MSMFIGLYQGDRRIAARIMQTRYGKFAWRLRDDEAARFKRRWIPTEAKDLLKRLGLAERFEVVPEVWMPTKAPASRDDLLFLQTARRDWGQTAQPVAA